MAFIEPSSAVQAGLALGTASIMSIGPNNLMLVREGLFRGRTIIVATTVWASYVALLVSACCVGDILALRAGSTRTILAWLGLITLIVFAAQSLRAALTAGRLARNGEPDSESARLCLARVMAVVWLNPLTYLELFLIPAALCGSFAATGLQLQFLATLVVMAGVACYGYAFGGALVASFLQSGKILQTFDLLSGLLLAALALVMVMQLASAGPGAALSLR